MRFFRSGMAALLVSGAALALPPAALAQQTAAIHMIHGQGHGGTTDALARILANEWTQRRSQNVVVESRPGAATSLAAGLVAKAKPDGQTLLFTASGHAANPFLLGKLPYDTAKDFHAIGLIASTPYVLVVNPELPVSTPAELAEYLKTHQDEASVAVTSIGSAQHISAALYRAQSGVDMVFIPYKGSADQLSDVIAGRVPVAFDNIVAIGPQIKAGAVRALALTSKERSPLFPDIPTLAESGYPDFDIVGWFGALVPADTPPATIQDYGNFIRDLKEDPAVVDKITTLGATVVPGGADEAEAFVQAELKKTGQLIRDLNITLN